VTAVRSEEYCKDIPSTELSQSALPGPDDVYLYKKYVIETNNDQPNDDRAAKRLSKRYDAVIMTAPLGPVNDIAFILDGKKVDTSRYQKPFKVTHTTFIKGCLNRGHFSPTTTSSGVPSSPLPPPVSSLDSVLCAVFGKAYKDPSVLPSTVYLTESGTAKVSALLSAYSILTTALLICSTS
jgi:hypothetical protein